MILANRSTSLTITSALFAVLSYVDPVSAMGRGPQQENGTPVWQAISAHEGLIANRADATLQAQIDSLRHELADLNARFTVLRDSVSDSQSGLRDVSLARR